MTQTPTPWTFEEKYPEDFTSGKVFNLYRIRAGTRVIPVGYDDESKIVAKLIVHCVNNIEKVEKERDELLEAAKKASELLENVRCNYSSSDGTYLNSTSIKKRLKKAIQRAEGKES